MKKNTVFKFGELFCGPGGLAWAAKNAFVHAPVSGDDFRIQHAWATDCDGDTCDTYRANICPHAPASVVCADVRNLKFAALEKISSVDAVAFGFPCNDFSVVGEQKGMDGAHGPLYQFGVKALRHFQPKWFLAENVGGLRNANEGQAFVKILNAFFRAGYSVYPHLYKFERYGVPQARHRIIIIGIRKDVDVLFKVPAAMDATKTCREAIEHPPIADGAPNHDYTKQSESVVARLRHIKPGENAFTADMPDDLRLNVRGAKISQIYKRLAPDKPAYTITGSGGGGTHVYHWKEDRALTNRERARLQTFPDEFVFCGSKESVRKQIGMAVPPAGVQLIFEALLKCFAGMDYRCESPNMPPLLQPSHVTPYNVAEYDPQTTICDAAVEAV